MGAVVGVTSVIVVPLALASPAAAAGAICTPDTGYTNCLRYTYTGADDSFTVPAGVTSVAVKLWGAGGGGSQPGGPGSFNAGGGGGGFTTATVGVTSGATLSIMVGEQGHSSGSATYGGGAAGGAGYNAYSSGGSGGGMSAVFSDSTDATPLLIAGGGGGSGGSSAYSRAANYQTLVGGGGGGGATGTAVSSTAYFGGPGTQLAGGDAGTVLDTNCTTAGLAGSQHSGGAGGSTSPNTYQNAAGGAGGGGYFGGGGGACAFDDYQHQSFTPPGGAGGGGSAYVGGVGVSNATTTAGGSALGIFNTAVSGGAGDPLYDAGVGQGGSFQDGGSGEIVVEWNVPAAPTPGALTSNGAGMAGQTAQVAVPDGGSVTLLNGSNAVNSITVPNEGGYTLNPVTGVISFAPAAGFTGVGAGVTYQVTDAYGQSASSTYTPDVALPVAPTLQPVSTSGAPGAVQRRQLPVPPGGSLMLLSGSNPVTSLAIPGRGTYAVDPTTGLATFTPLAGFVGNATQVFLRVSDAYGRHADATYSATVIADEVVASATAPALMKVVTQAQTMPVVCTLTVRKLGHCDVTLVYKNSRGSYVVGTGSASSSQAGGTAGHLVTQVTLNATGHYLAGIGIIPTWVYVGITPYGSRAALSAVTRTAFVNYNVK